MKLTEKQIREGIRKILVKEFRGMAATTQGTLPARGLATQSTALAVRGNQLVPYTRPITTQVVGRALTPQVASQVFSHPVPQVARVVAAAGPQGGFIGPAQLVVGGAGGGGAGTTTALATTAGGGGGGAAAAGVTLSAATVLAALAAGAVGWAIGSWLRENAKFKQDSCANQIRYQAYQETGNIRNFDQGCDIYSDSHWNDYIRRNPGWQGIGPNQIRGGSGQNCRRQLMLYFLAKETGNLSSFPVADRQEIESLFNNKYLSETLFKDAYDRAVARGQRELEEQARSAEQQRLAYLRSQRAARSSAASAPATTPSAPSTPTSRTSTRSRSQFAR